MRRLRPTIVAILAVLVCACAQPVPADKSAFVGTWHSETMSLSITQEGRVSYRRDEGATHTSLEGPLKGFDRDNFSVGIGFLATNFVVSDPPHQDGDEWKMTVDGVELTRR